MQAQEMWERTEIWPIWVRMLHRAGYTLWARRSDVEVVLTLDRHLVWCRTTATLREFLGNDTASNLVTLGGYAEFREAAVHSGDSDTVLKPHDRFDFNKVTSYLTSSDWSQWNMATCKDALDCFNLLWDMAITVGDSKVVDDAKSDKQVHTFLDTLTFITPEEIKDLSAFDSGHISAVFTENVARMVTRVILLC